MKILLGFRISLVVLLFCGGVFAQLSDRDRGIDLYRDGKFADAIESLEKSVAANDTDRAAWLFLAGAYVHTGEEGKATKAFRKTVVRPTTPQPRYESSVKITYKPRAGYTEYARRNLSSGKVRIAVELRSDGTIGFAFPLPTTIDRELVQQSLAATKGIKFEPAMKNGKPVTVISFVEHGFSVR